jgi:hypothetical protein
MSRRKRGWRKAPVSGPRVAWRKPLPDRYTHVSYQQVIAKRSIISNNITLPTTPTYQRLSLRVNEGYFVDARASTASMYFGKTFSVNTSGLIMTNERPCGNHATTSERDSLFKIAIRRWGKISRLCTWRLEGEVVLLSSSSISTTR